MLTAVLKPLADLTAADLVSGGLVIVRVGASVEEAARQLARTGVTGAPVVDADGRLVGVFSTSDLVRYLVRTPSTGTPKTCPYQDTLRGRAGQEVVLCSLATGRCLFQREGAVAGRPTTMCAGPHEVSADWQVVERNALPADDVRHHMTADPVTVCRSAPLRELARLMADGGIHRVVVVDDDFRPEGVVSSLDVVAAVAHAPPASTPPVAA